MAALTEDSHALDNVFEFNGHAFSVSWSSDGRLKGSDKLITKSAEATVLIERVRQPASLSFQVVNNLKEFRKKTCIKRTALLALSFTASSKDLEDLAAQFKEFDVDCTGAISLADFTNQMRAHPAAADTSDDDLRAQFAAIDQDNSGEIQYTEFLAAAMTQRIYTDAQLKAAFKRLDIGDSGGIAWDDLRHLGWSESHIKALYTNMGMESSGCVNYAKFALAVSASDPRGEPEGEYALPEPPALLLPPEVTLCL